MKKSLLIILCLAMVSVAVYFIINLNNKNLLCFDKSKKYYLSGKEKVSNNNHIEAIKDFKKAISLNPKDYKSYNNICACSYELKKYTEGLNDCNVAIKIKPLYTNYFNRALIKTELGDYQGAVDDYTESLKLNPDNIRAVILRDKAKQKIKK